MDMINAKGSVLLFIQELSSKSRRELKPSEMMKASKRRLEFKFNQNVCGCMCVSILDMFVYSIVS